MDKHKKKRPMQSVTTYAAQNKDSCMVNVSMIAPMQLNVMNAVSQNCLYGTYTGMWLQFKCTGQLPHMERITRSCFKRKRSRKWHIVKQGIMQYRTLQKLRTHAEPTKEFMRIVFLKDNFFQLSNRYDWVDMNFLKSALRTLWQQIRLLPIDPKGLMFEVPVHGQNVSGYCDIYCKSTDTVIELKTCKFVKKEHFVQLNKYAQLLKAKQAYLINCVDGSVWKLH